MNIPFKTIISTIRIGLILSMVGWFAFGQVSTTVFADPLSSAELKELNNNPNWVACGAPATDSEGNVSSGGSSTNGVTFQDKDNERGDGQTTWDDDGSGSVHGSATHQNETAGITNGGKALNADKINYFVLNTGFAAKHHIKPKDVAKLTYKGKTAYAVWGDTHNTSDAIWSEISYAASAALNGGHADNLKGVTTTVYPGTSSEVGSSFDQAKIDQLGQQLTGVAASSGGAAPEATASGGGCCSAASSDNTGDTSGNTSEKAKNAFVYLVEQGHLSKIAAAGLVGNFIQESGVDTHADNGTHKGIAQWDIPGRWHGLETWAKGKDVYDLKTQLEYVMQELGGGYKTSVANPLKNASSVTQAATIVFEHYEIAGDSTLPKRIANAKGVLRDYGDQVTESISSDPASADASGATGDCGAVDVGQPNFVDMTGSGASGMGHGKLDKIDSLVIHYTQGNTEGAALRSFFLSSTPGYGVQFNIGRTGKVYNYFKLDNMQEAWHVGAINNHSIGIEITGADGNALINNQAQFTAVVSTVKFLCSKYSIPCSQPNGTITGNSNDPAGARGLLGHDEAPNPTCGDCRHSDPDTKINGGGEYNIVTGKLWTDADRKHSNTHAYMMKLRKALGYDETPS